MENNKRYNHEMCPERGKRRSAALGRPWFDGDVMGNQGMGQPPLLVQSSKYRRPAPPRNEPTRREFLAGISRGILGVHVKEFGFVPRAVCVKNQSSRIRAPQPGVARDPRTIRPAPPYECQRFETPFRGSRNLKVRKEAPQPRVDMIRGSFKCLTYSSR